MALLTSRDLSSGWEFKQTDDDSKNAWLPVAKVPTVVHIDLIANDRIPNPSLDMNELDVHWVGQRSWSYRCQFQAPCTTQGTNIALILEGLDTFATVMLNGCLILESDNMFILHRIDITDQLHFNTSNVLQIDFDSALLRARDIREAHPEHRYIAHQGEPERIGVRKAQYHWGWDWGPRLMTAGPWRPVRLETYTGRIVDFSTEYTLNDDLTECCGEISINTVASIGDVVRTSMKDHSGRLVFEEEVVLCSDLTSRIPFVLQNPNLWYPHGFGDQKGYKIEVSLLSSGIVLHRSTKRIGLRKASLVQEEDSFGKSFFFRINGIDVFAGGSCWIPADNLIPRLTPDNVWGGGIYEEDVFYDLCDELGILVWQDFLFGCGSYPTFPSFLESVEKEARANIRRLRHHPSIILWAGGNEDYQICEKYNLEYEFEKDKDPQSWLKSSFPSRFIFEHLLPMVVADESPSIPYHPSSPWGDGQLTSDPTVGDTHQWNVWHGTMTAYQNFGNIGSRFVSEFGMEAFPHLYLIDQFITDPSEKFPQSATMDFHNKADGHERRLATYIHENFRVLSGSLSTWVHLTQILQSEAMHYAYRSWRRQWGSAGSRRCGGALVWQLNDCWPTISWAVVDHYLVPKPAFYAISRALRPMAVCVLRSHTDWTKGHTSRPAKCTYDIWIASSKIVTVENAMVEVRFVSIASGEDIQPRQNHHISIAANGTTSVLNNIELVDTEHRHDFVISAKLLIEGDIVSYDVDWPQPYKYISFQKDRGLRVTGPDNQGTVIVISERPVKGLVFAERPGLILSDNGFDVVPGEIYDITVTGLVDGKLSWNYLGWEEAQRERTSAKL